MSSPAKASTSGAEVVATVVVLVGAGRLVAVTVVAVAETAAGVSVGTTVVGKAKVAEGAGVAVCAAVLVGALSGLWPWQETRVMRAKKISQTKLARLVPCMLNAPVPAKKGIL